MDSRHLMKSEQTAFSALDALEVTVNTLLLHTASVFVDPTNHDDAKTFRTSDRIKQFMHPAFARFHDSLDELEGDLIRTKAVILRDLAFCRGRRKQEGLQNSDASSQTIVSKGPDIIMSEYPQEVEARHGETTESVRTKQDVDVVMTDNASKGASTTMVASKPENFDADTISPVHTSHVNAVAAAVTAALPDIQQDYEISAQVVANKEGGEQRSSDMPDVSRTAIVDRSTSPSKQSKPPKSIAHDSSDGSDEHIYKDASRADHPPPGDATTFATDRLLGMAQSEFAYTDVNSLLPGLEIYANGNGDAAFDGMDYMANLSTSNTRTRQDAAAETRFDDVFSFGDFTGEGPEQGGLDTQFDEEFFNLDNS